VPSKNGGVARPSSEARGKRMSRVREIAGSSGGFPIPDPQSWPAEIRAWLRDIKHGADSGSVAIFHDGQNARVYCEDAVLALALFNVNPSQWDVESGFPVFTFDPARIDAYRQQLAAYGFQVQIFDLASDVQESRQTRARAEVVDITTARARLEQKAKGAIL